MNAQLSNLSDQIFDIKDKCTDQEYKNLMDILGKIYNEQNVEDSEDPFDPQEELELRLGCLRNMERPLRGTKEWCLLSVATKAMYCGMTVDEFIKDEQRKLHWADKAFYESYPQYVPYYLKKKTQVQTNSKMETKLEKKENNCMIC